MPLPNNQVLDGFTVNGANTVFTVPSTGTYLISYRVNVSAAVLMTSEILRNGAVLPGSTFSPTASTGSYSVMLVSNLTAGDTLELRLTGLIGATVLQGGTGASLAVIKLA